MASNTYPKIPAKNWWLLRQRFKQSLPSAVTPNYLATLLGITERGAKNILPNLRAVGLIDENGNTTERAKHWRDDKDYKQVCEEIRRDAYPDELRDVAPDPVNHFDAAVRWFMRDTGTGEGNAKQMASLYQLVTKADPTEGQEVQPATTKTSRTTRPRSKRRPTNSSRKSASENGPPAIDETPLPPPSRLPHQAGDQVPSVHIDIQIHIAADAKPDQIDQIFASMAKHLYNKESGS